MRRARSEILGLLKLMQARLRCLVGECASAVSRSKDESDWNYESFVLQMLRESNVRDIGALIDHVAECALRVEQSRGGYIVDIAVWGPAVFRREATHAVFQMIGQDLVLEGEGECVFLCPLITSRHQSNHVTRSLPQMVLGSRV